MEPSEPSKPSPPRPELLKPGTAALAASTLTPLMEFFQKRLETLERELALERERSSAAQGLLARQEALKSEVESNLKELTAQLRREKSEKEDEEARVRAQGRIEALEKRLDEMNSTFAQLLKEAVGRRETEDTSAVEAHLSALRDSLQSVLSRYESDRASASALAKELASFRGSLSDAIDGVARWKGELRGLSDLAPRIGELKQELSERLPKEEKLFEEGVGRRLDEFTARVARSMEDWKRAQEAESLRQGERIEALIRERDELTRLWSEQSRQLREEQFKDRVARESEVTRQIAALASRLEALSEGQTASAQGSASLRESIARVIALLTATPKAKEMLLADAEMESAELRRALTESQEALRRYAGERRGVEKSMGDSLVRLSVELEDERARTRTAEALAAERLGVAESLKARLSDLEQAVAARAERISSLCAERDELARSLLAEADKVRRSIEERREAEAEVQAQTALLRKRLEDEVSRRELADNAAGESRARVVAMADQVARTTQQMDGIVAKFSDWEKERQRLLATIQKKDETISLLSSTVRGALKK